jgi:glycosyltransferase involved in cell wall biosynthesis
MSSLTLSQLPSACLTGASWTKEPQSIGQVGSCDISKYPRISIITPSYNQGHFIEETIRSVLLQGYPNLEYIIIDGDSTDNTVKIIKKYEPWLTYWVSESDRGQTHAINKGFARATGEILAYINSDDYYLPGTFFRIAEHFNQHPEIDLLHGRCRYVNEAGEKVGEQLGNIQSFEEIIDLWGVWWQKRQFVQPEVFWSRRIADRVGTFNEALNYVMDYDYWCRILKAGGKVERIESELACFRFTANQKSNQSDSASQELLSLVQPFLWDQSTPISNRQRSKLQGMWLYQAKFLKQVEQSIQSNESKLRRWFKLIKLVSSHPSLLLSDSLYARIYQVLSAQFTHTKAN